MGGRLTDVLRRQVDAQALLRDLELARRVAVREEAERHDEVQDRLLRELGQAGDVHGLGVVPEPVSEVDALDVETAKLAAAAEEAARLFDELGEGVFDVAVAEGCSRDGGRTVSRGAPGTGT